MSGTQSDLEGEGEAQEKRASKKVRKKKFMGEKSGGGGGEGEEGRHKQRYNEMENIKKWSG